MIEFVVCTVCGNDTFIIYRNSIECISCSKTYHFNDARYFSEIADLVKDMD